MSTLPFGQKLRAGTTWDFDVSFADYSAADGYTLNFYLRGPQTLDIIGTADGAGFNLLASATATAGLVEGDYNWLMTVTKAGVVTQVGAGAVEVLPDLAAQGAGYDGRSFAKKMLDAVRKALTGTMDRVEQEYTVNGRMLKLMSRKELIDLEAQFLVRYNNELIESGQKPGRSSQVHMRFGA